MNKLNKIINKLVNEFIFGFFMTFFISLSLIYLLVFIFSAVFWDFGPLLDLWDMEFFKMLLRGSCLTGIAFGIGKLVKKNE